MAEKPQPLDLDRLAVEVAKLSAEQDEDGSWWGFDTDIGDLPREIKNVIRRRLKSACEFYLKYKDNPELLAEEHPEYFSYIYKFEVIGDCKNVLVVNFKDILIDADQYNEWLFKLAFKSVFDENEND